VILLAVRGSLLAVRGPRSIFSRSAACG